MQNTGMPCYYVNPNCSAEPSYIINEFHIDVWVTAYTSCSDHIDYLLNYIRRNNNYAKVTPVATPHIVNYLTNTPEYAKAACGSCGSPYKGSDKDFMVVKYTHGDFIMCSTCYAPRRKQYTQLDLFKDD